MYSKTITVKSIYSKCSETPTITIVSNVLFLTYNQPFRFFYINVRIFHDIKTYFWYRHEEFHQTSNQIRKLLRTATTVVQQINNILITSYVLFKICIN